jgi:hypothetical protein
MHLLIFGEAFLAMNCNATGMHTMLEHGHMAILITVTPLLQAKKANYTSQCHMGYNWSQ